MCQTSRPYPSDKNPGRVAYVAYANSVAWVSLITGDRLPHWEELDVRVQEAWHSVARVVRAYYGAY